MIHNKYVDDYYQKWRDGKLVLNKNRIKLMRWLEKEILSKDDLYYFDEEQIDDFISFTETWYYPLEDWQYFISCFIFMYYKGSDRLVFRIFLLIMGRGAGKNGFLSPLAHYLISSLHGVDEYDVSIVANNEEQAKRSFNDVFNAIIKEHKLSAINTRDTLFDEEPIGEFEPWKSNIKSVETQAKLMFHTSNAKTKDGGREGAIMFDEFHEYENSTLVKVFTGGLGKVPYPRQFFTGTKGFVREGYFDMMYNRAINILDGKRDFNGMFPYICELDDTSEMDDEAMWEKANPALQKPLTERGERLTETIRDEYLDLLDEPSGRPAFVVKRMNLVEADLDHSVASPEDLDATNREPFDTTGLVPIGSLDFGSVRDFAACGLLFMKSNEYYFKTHSFVMKHFVDVHYGYSNSGNMFASGKVAPIKDWEKKGLLTVKDEPTLNPNHIVDWFIQAREEHGVQTIVADRYRLEILGPLLEDAGFDVHPINNPKAIHPLLAPRIEDAFANRKIIFGDNPMMRWYTNNVYVEEKESGKTFQKKERTKRKIDGFDALIYGMYLAKDLKEPEAFAFADFFD